MSKELRVMFLAPWIVAEANEIYMYATPEKVSIPAIRIKDPEQTLVHNLGKACTDFSKKYALNLYGPMTHLEVEGIDRYVMIVFARAAPSSQPAKAELQKVQLDALATDRRLHELLDDEQAALEQMWSASAHPGAPKPLVEFFMRNPDFPPEDWRGRSKR